MNPAIDKLSSWIFKNKTLVLFLVLCTLGIYASGQSLDFVLNELLTRVGRNSFLVLSLLIPIQAGMGLNFAVVIGAMSAQIAIFVVSCLEVGGIGGFLLCALIAVSFSILFGFLTGKLFNKMKGSEMIGGMILSYFSDGLYQLLFLFILGGIIPVKSNRLMISNGVGVKNTIDLSGNLKYALDDLMRITFLDAVTWLCIGMAVFYGVKLLTEFRRLKKAGSGSTGKELGMKYGVKIAGAALVLLLTFIPFVEKLFLNAEIPLVTYGVIALVCLFNTGFMKTVLGQNMRTIGQSMQVAKASGINVNKTRIIAITISTLLASWGQLILLQNMGTMSTYGAHTQIGQFAIAALLVGGASVHSATNTQAVIGVLLFHTLFIVSPDAGKNLFHNAQIGEYFRVFVSYGVIAVSLALHAWHKRPRRAEAGLEAEA